MLGPRPLHNSGWLKVYLPVWLVSSVLAATVVAWLAHRDVVSMLLGCGVDWFPSALFATMMLSKNASTDPSRFFRRMVVGEIAKWASTALIFYGIIAANHFETMDVLIGFGISKILSMVWLPWVDQYTKQKRTQTA